MRRGEPREIEIKPKMAAQHIAGSEEEGIIASEKIFAVRKEKELAQKFIMVNICLGPTEKIVTNQPQRRKSSLFFCELLLFMLSYVVICD